MDRAKLSLARAGRVTRPAGLSLKVLGVLAAGLLGVASTSPASAFGVGVQPTTVELITAPGKQSRQTITVGNVHRSKTLTLTVGVADWALDRDGGLKLSAPGRDARSAAHWLRFSPASFALKPGEARQVVVDVETPASGLQPGDYRAALLVSTVLPAPDQRPEISGVWQRHQIASLFYVNIGEENGAPVVSAASATRTDKGRPAIALEIDNPGEAHARLSGALRLIGPGGEERDIEFKTVVLDRSSRRVVTSLDAAARELPAGRYRVEVDLSNTFTPGSDFRPEEVRVEAAPVQITLPGR